MDVVKRVIDNMRGKLEVNSEPNNGTVIWLKLPLTLAIIDGIIVRAGKRDYIMPTASVSNRYVLRK
jgi:Chemotaxis protein histidine kinase and related kinases